MQAVGTDKTQKLCDEFLLHSRQLCHTPSLQLDLVNGNNTTLHTYIETT